MEEKLDGANVILWLQKGAIECALRSGVGAMDRAGQLGPLRAWVGQQDNGLRAVLSSYEAVYGEWLLLRHTVSYDQLPSYMVVLDLWNRSGFAPPDERVEKCVESDLAVPPEVWRGTPGSVEAIEGRLGTSQWGPEPMEGLIVRSADGTQPRLAKLLRSGFERVKDDAWRRGRPRNRVVDSETSWR